MLPAIIFVIINYFVVMTVLALILKTLKLRVFLKDILIGGLIGTVIAFCALSIASLLVTYNETFWWYNKVASAALIIITCLISAVALISTPIILNIRRRKIMDNLKHRLSTGTR